MKKIAFKSSILALVVLFAAGCSNMNQRQKNTAIGAAVGGVAGNVIGNSTGATLGGAALGGVIGSQID
ncbi:glycine zipper 2TM domain-containing protein [Testudinibacter sp. P27/CKL/0425]